MTAALRGLTPGQTEVLYVIAELAEAMAPAVPAVHDIARELDDTTFAVRRWLAALCNSGWIAWAPSRPDSLRLRYPPPPRTLPEPVFVLSPALKPAGDRHAAC